MTNHPGAPLVSHISVIVTASGGLLLILLLKRDRYLVLKWHFQLKTPPNAQSLKLMGIRSRL